MKEHASAAQFKSEKGTVVTIGTFDGVHIGHRTILDRLVETARAENLEATLLTFFPHPRMVLQKDSDLKLINTLDEKKTLLAQIGLDHLVVQPFTLEFSRITALEYVRDILVNQLNAKKIIIGYDHRFGRNRTANIEHLRDYGETYGFEVEEITAQELDEVAVSSTKIRKALAMGDITTANKFLGYPFELSGTVVKGKGIGKTIHYPTANLNITTNYKLIPAKGVYLVQATIDNRSFYGLTSIGTNPTVGGSHTTVETFFLDLDRDLYGKVLNIRFITHIRDEVHFDSIEDLISAIKDDEKFARAFITNNE